MPATPSAGRRTGRSGVRTEGQAPGGIDLRRAPGNASLATGYLTSTVAPASSNCFLILAASSLLMPSLTGLGAPSTKSLASLRPRPVIARTSLITLIFFSPAAAKMMLNSVFSTAGAAAAAPPPAAATATGAAADTPHFSSSFFDSSAASMTVSAERSSTSLLRSAMLVLLGILQGFQTSAGLRLLRIGTEHAGDLTAGRLQHRGDPCRRGLQHAEDLAPELIERRQGCEGFDPRDVKLLLIEAAPDDPQLFVPIGELDGHLRRGHRVPRESDRGGSGEHRRQLLEFRALECTAREPVLGHFEVGARRTHLTPQVRHFLDRHAGLVGDDDAGGVRQRLLQRGDQLLFLCPVHSPSPTVIPGWGSVARGRRKDARFACPRSP